MLIVYMKCARHYLKEKATRMMIIYNECLELPDGYKRRILSRKECVILARFPLLLINVTKHPAVAAHFTPFDDSVMEYNWFHFFNYLMRP
jgi:hypothetical protein